MMSSLDAVAFMTGRDRPVINICMGTITEKDFNSLDVLGIRRTAFLPVHFESVEIPFYYNIETSLVDWITTNLMHRFYVGKNIALDSNNKIIKVVTVGFEDPQEMSYFMIACPLLNYC